MCSMVVKVVRFPPTIIVFCHLNDNSFRLALLAVDQQQIQSNPRRTWKNICSTPESAQFRLRSPSAMSWSAWRGPSVGQLAPIFSTTTAAVFCTIVARRHAHSLRTPANGCQLQRTTAIHAMVSNSTAEFACPVKLVAVTAEFSVVSCSVDDDDDDDDDDERMNFDVA